MQGGIAGDDVGVALICFVFEVFCPRVIIERARPDLVSDGADDLGGVWAAEPSVSVFGGVEFCVCQSFYGV
jgi:hypothetical protein